MRRHQSTDENLINFNTYSKTALKNIFYNQAYDAMKNSRQEEKGDLFVKLTEEQKTKTQSSCSFLIQMIHLSQTQIWSVL